MRLTIFILLVMLAPSLWADDYTASKYDQLSSMYQTGLHENAMQEARDYLDSHPQDADVRIFLAKAYLDQKNTLLARYELLTVLQDYPAYTDASLILANIDYSAGNYSAALDTVSMALVYHPSNPELITQESNILASMHHSVLPAAPTIKPRVKTLVAKKPAPAAPPQYIQEIGTIQQQYYISSNHAVWDYSTVYYGHHTDIGIMFAKATYDNRLNKQAVQGEFEIFPIINKNIYLDLDFAFADQPVLFPDKAVGAEAFVAGKLIDYSVGARYNDVDKRHYYTVYTGNVAKSIDNNRALFRPFFFIPGHGNRSQLFTLDLRHTITDPYFYFGCILGIGTSPDLANLETIDFIVVKNKLINPYVNFSLLNDRLIVYLSALVQNQIFTTPVSFIRNWYGGTIGLDWKF